MIFFMWIIWIYLSWFHGTATFWNEGIQNSVKFCLISWLEFSLFFNFSKETCMGSSHMSKEFGFKFRNFRCNHLVKISSNTSENNANLLLGNHGNLYKNLITNCFCFNNSVSWAPLLRSCWVAASKSEPNCANAAT